LKEAGLSDLRHSSASMLLGIAVHPKVVQELLGHSQIAMTRVLLSGGSWEFTAFGL
jgi:site-specific recombinase XerD